MKSLAVIAIVLSVFVIQVAVAEDWKDSVARECKSKFLKFAADMIKILNQGIIIGGNPACVQNAIRQFQFLSNRVIRDVDSCVNSASDRYAAERCAKLVVDGAVVESMGFTNC